MRQKNFRSKNLWTFVHVKLPKLQEKCLAHTCESLSSLLVEVAMTPPPISASHHMRRDAQRGSRVAAIAPRQWQQQQRGGNVQLGSLAVASSLAVRRWRQA